MMDIRKVRVFVRYRRVLVKMLVRLSSIPVKRVLMLVVLVMHVAMAVFLRFVRVGMFVPFRQVQIHAEPHQPASHPECRRGWFARRIRLACCD